MRYSFTLLELTPDGSRVRVQTDSTDQPFDINEGSKLELGSTAKLRVLTTYLQIIAELHERYAGQSPAQLKKTEIAEQDRLSRWAVDYLIQNSDRNLPKMLEAALDRTYSASPGEAFFTGGGLHTFHNFRSEDNGRNPTLRDSLRESINLPFIRLMRDLVRYATYAGPSNSAELLKDDRDPRRQEYLAQFADREGTSFLLKFWKKYQKKDTSQRLETFLDSMHPTAIRLAAVHRYFFPNDSQESFNRFVRSHLKSAKSAEKLTDERLERLYQSYGPGAYDLPDQGFIAKVHPLDLWLMGYLLNNPDAKFSQIVKASEFERQEVYSWLFKSRHKSARDSRIRTMLEIEAFLDIHQRWQKVGYPFDHLVPSLATAIGSSGDRPAALAELVGTILNDGVRLPALRVDSLHFAANTPYETQLVNDPDNGKQVMPVEVARALRGHCPRWSMPAPRSGWPGVSNWPMARHCRWAARPAPATTASRPSAPAGGSSVPSPSTAPPPSCSTSATAISARSPPTFRAPRRRTSNSLRPCRCRFSRAWRPYSPLTCNPAPIPNASRWWLVGKDHRRGIEGVHNVV